jgi:hypothetical protein
MIVAATVIGLIGCSGASRDTLVFARVEGGLQAFRFDDRVGLAAIGDADRSLDPKSGVGYNGRFVYGLTASGRSGTRLDQIDRYLLDDVTGRLTQVGTEPLSQFSSHSVSGLKIAGGFLLLSYGPRSTGTGGGLSAYAIDEQTGALTWRSGFFSSESGAVFDYRPGSDWLFGWLEAGNEGPFESRFPLIGVRGVLSGRFVQQVLPARFNLTNAFFRPISMVAHPNLDVLYYDLGSRIEMLEFDAGNGSVKRIQPVDGEAASVLAADPLGRFLFVAEERGIRVYDLDASGGIMGFQEYPVPEPMAFLRAEPAGNYLLATGRPSPPGNTTRVYVYRIGRTTLEPVGEPRTVVGRPFIVESGSAAPRVSLPQ